MRKNQLHIDNLNIGYKTTSVAQNINFTLDEGELCAIVGVNGIGKSTLLRTLARLQPKISGSIAIDNTALESHSSSDLAKKMGLVLTESIASKNLSVQELITLGRQPYTNWLGTLTKEDKNQIEKSITIFGLNDLKHKKCHELSDGQLQKVMIARAMAQNTPIILLDEPTTHLDLHHKVQILKLLQQLAHQNKKTILFTSHEIDLAIQLCDKILILDGDKNPFGTPKELITNKHFENLFPKDIIQFDAATGVFKVK